MAVGSAAQGLWRTMVEEELMRRIENPRSKKSAAARREIRKQQKRSRDALQDIRLRERSYGPARKGRAASEQALNRFNADTAPFRDTLKKASARIEEITQSETAAGRSGRYISIAMLKPPSHIRLRVLEKLAAHFEISESSVARHWTSWRKLEADISRDLP
jgi:hypothetical protein